MITGYVDVYRVNGLLKDENARLRAVLSMPDIKEKIESSNLAKTYMRDADVCRAEINKIEAKK